MKICNNDSVDLLLAQPQMINITCWCDANGELVGINLQNLTQDKDKH